MQRVEKTIETMVNNIIADLHLFNAYQCGGEGCFEFNGRGYEEKMAQLAHIRAFFHKEMDKLDAAMPKKKENFSAWEAARFHREEKRRALCPYFQDGAVVIPAALVALSMA